MAIITVKTGGIAADAVTDAKIADDVVGTEHLTANEVDTAALKADAVTGAQLADDAINSEHYTDGSIDTAHIADVNVTQGKIADQAINEAKMQISNAPTNGYFLSAQSGNTGGMTWAEAGGGVSASFQAIGTASGTHSGALVLATELHDDGGNYNASNGRYTAPSTGYYLFVASALISGSSGTKFYFTKNGSAISSTDRWGYNGAGNQNQLNTYGILSLSSGDYVHIYSDTSVYSDQFLNFGGCKLY